MFEKYISIKESNIVVKQTSGGVWYCSELPAHTTIELEGLIGEVNRILNKYNINGVKKPKDKKLDPNHPISKMIKQAEKIEQIRGKGLL